jgi:hypothetical protein
MLGHGKSRGYCLEMICADFLAGVNLHGLIQKHWAWTALALGDFPRRF